MHVSRTVLYKYENISKNNHHILITIIMMPTYDLLQFLIFSCIKLCIANGSHFNVHPIMTQHPLDSLDWRGKERWLTVLLQTSGHQQLQKQTLSVLNAKSCSVLGITVTVKFPEKPLVLWFYILPATHSVPLIILHTGKTYRRRMAYMMWLFSSKVIIFICCFSAHFSRHSRYSVEQVTQ